MNQQIHVNRPLEGRERSKALFGAPVCGFPPGDSWPNPPNDHGVI